jgi:hypothetical protein
MARKKTGKGKAKTSQKGDVAMDTAQKTVIEFTCESGVINKYFVYVGKVQVISSFRKETKWEGEVIGNGTIKVRVRVFSAGDAEFTVLITKDGTEVEKDKLQTKGNEYDQTFTI